MIKSNLLKALIMIFIIDAAALAGWWRFYRGINNMSSSLDILREEVLVAETKQKNIKLLAQTLDTISEKKSKIDTVFIDEQSVVRFIEDLEEVASTAGVSLEIASASLPTQTGAGGPSFDLKLGGSFGRLLKFLTMIEKTSYQLKIETASFGALEEGRWSLQLKLQLLSYKFI